MQQLQFVELDEGGRLVVAGDDGTRYAVTVDDRLRSALRPRPVATHPDRGGAPAVSPRDVQALIRAGQTAEDVAKLTGWELERVQRFEGPVLAEREHLVGLAQRAHVRAAGRTDGSHTLDRRVRERLSGRGVELSEVTWDAARHEAHGPWTVLVVFSAGGRERRAAWHYDLRSRSIEALDDEARWLSEDEQSLPGGLAGHPLLGAGHGEDEVAADLMATMRERRQRRGRRRKESGAHDPAHLPGGHDSPDEVLPLEDLHYDPETMGEPPAAHPRGSAPEAAVPVGPDEFDLDDEPRDGPDATGHADDSPDTTGDAGDGPDVTGHPDGADATGHTDGAAGQAEADEDQDAPAAQGRRRGAPRKPPNRKERRRLRMPKLPVMVDGPVEEDAAPSPEHTFARTRRDPNEVSFDEFFGTDEEEVLEHHLYDEDFDEHDDLDEQDDLEMLEDEHVEDRDVEQPDGQDETAADLADELGEDTGPEPVEERAAERGDVEETDEPGADGPDKDDAGTDDARTDDQNDADQAEGDQAGADQAEGEAAVAEDPEPAPAAPPSSAPKPAPPKPAAPKPSPPGRKGRTSVPSWDDIMFGSRDKG